MKASKLFFFVVIMVATLHTTIAQEKPIRIGIKFGLPIIAGLSGEFVTPLAGKKLGVYADFSTFSPTVDDIELKMTYFEVGANYYLLKEGKGPYASVGYSSFASDFTFTGLESDSGKQDGTATVDYAFSGINLKVGAKLGGLFYFRPEIGYSLGTRASDITVVATFPDGSTETQTEPVPNLITNGLVASLSIGFSF